jgi:hypothetical protein
MNGCIFNKTRIVCSLLIGALYSGVSLASVIDVDSTTGNGADSYVSTWPGERDTNFGFDDTFYLKKDSGTGFVNRKGYVRFDLSSIQDAVEDVNLNLSFVEDTHTTPAVWSINVYGLSDGHAGEDWSETGITWNNAPANNTSSGGGLLGGEASLLGSFEFDTASLLPGDSVPFSSSDLTSFVQSDTNDLLTLIFIRQNRSLSNVGFATGEHATFAPPTLTLTTVPVPAAAVLFGSGFFWLFGTGFRRLSRG